MYTILRTRKNFKVEEGQGRQQGRCDRKKKERSNGSRKEEVSVNQRETGLVKNGSIEYQTR